jgi:N-methylhydantoinase B
MRLDALTVEILRNYLQGAVEEMAYVVERTAYTTFVKETADFTCGLLNPQGEFFAYPIELGVASFGGISYAATLEAVGPLDPATWSSPTTRTAPPPPPPTCPTSI